MVNSDLSWGQISTFSPRKKTGHNPDVKKSVNKLLSKRKIVYDFLAENYGDSSKIVRTTSRFSSVDLTYYPKDNLLTLITESEIPFRRRGRMYLDDHTKIDGTINREFFVIAVEKYGSISKLVRYCSNPTSK